MLDENRLQSDVGSGVLQIINASLHTVFLVLVVVFAALRGLPNLVVFSAIAFGAILVYFTISSITSFCGTLRAINVMLRIERALYAVSVVACNGACFGRSCFCGILLDWYGELA